MKKKSLAKTLISMPDRRTYLLNRFDRNIAAFMRRWGHKVERWALGILFCWFGTIKVFGGLTASSLIAKSIFWFEPKLMVPALGIWEIIMGLCLVIPHAQRIAILLLIARLPGSILALLIHMDSCFHGGILVPTIQGQYLLKEVALIGAALVIGGSLREEDP